MKVQVHTWALTCHPSGAQSSHPGFPGPPLAPPCPPLVLRTRRIPTSRQRPDVEREDSSPSRVPVKVYGRSGGQEVQRGREGQGESGESGDWEEGGVRGSRRARGSGGQWVRESGGQGAQPRRAQQLLEQREGGGRPTDTALGSTPSRDVLLLGRTVSAVRALPPHSLLLRGCDVPHSHPAQGT